MKHFNEIRSLVQRSEIDPKELLSLCEDSHKDDPEAYLDKIYPYLSSFISVRSLYLGKTSDLDQAKLWQELLPCKFGLYLWNNQVSDLSFLAYLKNLQELYLYNNQITDLSPLAGLTHLQKLDLGQNQIEDISPLAGLTKLQELYLRSNQVTDLSALSGLTNLQHLNLYANQVSDLTPVQHVPHLFT